MASVPSFSERERIVEMVRKWGGPTCDAVLDPTMSFFETPDVEGIVGYRIANGCAVVFGDPICPEGEREKLSKAFHQSMDVPIVYIWASKPYAQWAIENVCQCFIECGVEYFFNNPTDPRSHSGPHGSLIRRKIKQAMRDGVSVQEYVGSNLTIETGINRVKDLWLDGRHGLQVHISNAYLFEDAHGKRWFYAKQGDQIIGVVVLNRLDARNGWMMNHLMVIPDAPHGVSEFLISTAFETLEKEKSPYATVGAVAASKVGEIRGMNLLFKACARLAFKLSSKFMHLDRLNIYWGKYQPEIAPAYLLFSRDKIGLREIIGLKNAIDGSIK
jgi:lysylphosphatidylglycerol synthetase-like protein (DUF2156 family)